MTTFEAALTALEGANSVLLCGHEHPDGDCIGSLAALAAGLRALGKRADIFVADVPPILDCLLSNKLIADNIVFSEYDLIAALDCATLPRLSLPPGMTAASPDDLAAAFPKTLAIDHHASHAPYAETIWVDPEQPACGMMVLSLLDALNVKITPAMADALFVSISSDTTRFTNSNTTPAAFAAAARLTAAGAKVAWQKTLFDIRSPASARMLGILLSRYTLLNNGQIAAGYITHEESAATQAAPGDHEGLVDALRNIQGVETALFTRGKAEGGSKSSMRTVNLDASKFMAQYGGGGHPRAAGCDLPMPPDEACEFLCKELVKLEMKN
ncbi:MAG: DHH family phosphoesterase [Clostridia bacterium]|nr:DHH family phosphoesterase [Clostridia bacterium]